MPLDLALALTALRLALTRRYDAVHSHEEGGAHRRRARLAGSRVPHLYDMHSSLPQQVSNFGYGQRDVADAAARLARAADDPPLARRDRDLPGARDDRARLDADVPTVLIENAPGSGDAPPAGHGRRRFARRSGWAPTTPVVLYTGTFENYQGLDLLYAAMAVVRRARGRTRGS